MRAEKLLRISLPPSRTCNIRLIRSSRRKFRQREKERERGRERGDLKLHPRNSRPSSRADFLSFSTPASGAFRDIKTYLENICAQSRRIYTRIRVERTRTAKESFASLRLALTSRAAARVDDIDCVLVPAQELSNLVPA